MQNNMLDVVAANANDTLLVDPVSDPAFVDLLYSDHGTRRGDLDRYFQARDGLGGQDLRDIRKLIRETQKNHGIPDELQPNVINLASAIRKEGRQYGLVILSGMPADKALDRFPPLGMDVHAAYRVHDDETNRNDPETFRKVRKMMRSSKPITDMSLVLRTKYSQKDNPLVYWTHNENHARAAADKRGFSKAIFCIPHDYDGDLYDPGKTGIYTFTLDDLQDACKIGNILDFIYG